MSIFSKYSTERFRWWALTVLALGLAIVVIDNTVLNVAIPYILRDLNTSLESIQWVISGYALIIATVLIFMGRLGDIIGRKKVFIGGTVLFGIGSLMASYANSPATLFMGEALIEALGAAAMLTSSLSLLAGEFQGRERATAFGIWGAVAGASASIGPLLGGYFTTYHSWRWSLRINVLVAIVTILGTIFIKESRGEGETRNFDWLGIILSGLGLFSLVFGFIEGQKYGWWHSKEMFHLGNWNWPIANASVIPFAFVLAFIFLLLFVLWEIRVEKRGGTPVLKMSLLRKSGFSLSLITALIVSLGQFGIFFILPLYFQNVLGLTALKTGIAFLYASIAFMVLGAFSGFLASKIGSVKWVVVLGMFLSTVGTIWLALSIKSGISYSALGPAMILFGIGGGMATAQLTNLILSAVPNTYAGEASAASATVRQIGTSIGIAILGTVLVTSLVGNIGNSIRNAREIPEPAKAAIINSLNADNIESGNHKAPKNDNLLVTLVINEAVTNGFTDASKSAIWYAIAFLGVGTLVSIFIPETKNPVPPPAPNVH
jgi:EmrB/QacA subfamily drug resistance transporter